MLLRISLLLKKYSKNIKETVVRITTTNIMNRATFPIERLTVRMAVAGWYYC